ncbi:MAG: TOMM precursor leader peptide-binding protein [Planctomycetales bacterium]|nr:TOMM precursor leader peptide-binding protein [Planctomycetales bacterium]
MHADQRRLRPGVAVIAHGDHLQLRAGDEEIFVLEADDSADVGHWLAKLASGLTVAQVQADVRVDATLTWEAVVDQLTVARLLSDQHVDPDDEIGSYLSHFYESRRLIDSPLGRVLIHGGSRSAQLLQQALAEHHIESIVVDSGEFDSDIVESPLPTIEACVWEQADLSWAMKVNARAVTARCACLFVDLSHGRHATIGPFYIPGEGACFHCYWQRWRENTAAVEEFDAAAESMLTSGAPLPAYGLLPAFRYQVVGLACSELFAYLTRHRPLRTLNRIVTVDLEGLQTATEPCWRIPWCRTCGRDAP